MTFQQFDRLLEEIHYLSDAFREIAAAIRDSGKSVAAEDLARIASESFSEVLNRPLPTLGFSTRVRNAMHNRGVRTVGELAALTRDEIARTRSLGETSIREIEQKLNSLGLTFRGERFAAV